MPRRLDDDGDLIGVAANELIERHRRAFATVAPTNKYLALINKFPKVAAAFVQKMHLDQETP